MEEKNLIIEALKKEVDAGMENEKFQKCIKKKKRKIKKCRKRIQKLLDENAELKKKLKRKDKKYQELKKTLQIERYNFGFNPFVPTNTYRLLKNGKKQKAYFPIPGYGECSRTQNDFIPTLEGEYREV